MLLYRSMPSAIKKLSSSHYRQGFTLIELLVVMVILGFLTALGVSNFRSSQIKGRDAQRKHDLGQIQKALEMYLNDKGKYPLSTDGLPPAAGTPWTDANGTLYMKSVPSDPSGWNYCYQTGVGIADGTWYKLYAKLENSLDPMIVKTCPLPPGCTCGESSYNYMIGSPNAQ